MRIGFGYDVHQFSPDRKLWLGGIEVPCERGLLGHSDADVVIHALSDGIDSKILLRRVMAMLREAGYELGNCDITICAQAPKLNPYIDTMQSCLAEVMGVQTNQISLKATTTEHLGFVGREEGIAAYAVALIN